MVHYMCARNVVVQVVDQGSDRAVDGAQCAFEETEFIHAEVRDVLVRVLQLGNTY